MKGGIVLVAPCAVAACSCGLVVGLDPPTDGCAWQPLQLSRLNRGPNPFETESTSVKIFFAALKKFSSFWLRPGSGPPAPGDPVRTPGSAPCGETLPDVVVVVVACAKIDSGVAAIPNNIPAAPTDNMCIACSFDIAPSPKLFTHLRITQSRKTHAVDFCWPPIVQKREMTVTTSARANGASATTRRFNSCATPSPMAAASMYDRGSDMLRARTRSGGWIEIR